MREFELKCIIENLKMELDFQDLTKEEEKELRLSIKEAELELNNFRRRK